jgi:hypothetical protein
MEEGKDIQIQWLKGYPADGYDMEEGYATDGMEGLIQRMGCKGGKGGAIIQMMHDRFMVYATDGL